MLAILHSTFEIDPMRQLLDDLKRHGISVKVYGMGEPWHNWGDKLRSHYKAACEFPEETLLLLDAWDIRVIGNPGDNFISTWFCAEKGCFPEPELADQYPKVDSPWRFLNGGAALGYGRDFKAIIDQNPIHAVSNDQAYWTHRYLEAKRGAGPNICLDTNCNWFQSAAFSHRQQFADYGGRMMNLTTMSTPSILHFNGRTEMWEPDGLTGLEHESRRYQDTEDNHQKRYDVFCQLVGETKWLLDHRLFAEHGYGCGDRAFHWLWHLLVGEMPQRFRFLEIGVYKGQVLSLIQLLANAWKKEVGITGVTMLSDYSGTGEFPKYEDRDYLADIKAYHDAFTLNFDPAMLVVGDSTAGWVVKKTTERAPFDLVYIDGCHEYAFVKQDIENYASLVRPGGFLVMDDAACHTHQPWGFFQGIEPVSRAVQDTIEKDSQWEHVLTVVHNRVFRRK